MAVIATATGQPCENATARALSGGCISTASILQCGERRYFVKRNTPERAPMFAAEADGLVALAAAGAVRVPTPLCHGVADGYAFLALEYLALGSASGAAQEQLGRQLATLHRVTQPQFGWHRDNTIGSTPQLNAPTDHWPEFLRERRLRFQLQLAARQAAGRPAIALGEQLLVQLDGFFAGYRPRPSLLHGDLWSGNAAQTIDGDPAIFDPAVYFGDRETDVAMTELFGGFSTRFYGAYREAWPLDPGYGVRRDLYNLYHVLNHANLFGGGYWSQAERMMERLLAEIR